MNKADLIPEFENMCKRCGFDLNQPFSERALGMIITLFLITENSDSEENFQLLMQYGLPD